MLLGNGTPNDSDPWKDYAEPFSSMSRSLSRFAPMLSRLWTKLKDLLDPEQFDTDAQ